MTLPFETLDDFFDITEFAEAVTLDVAPNDTTINVIFDNAHFDVEDADVVTMSSLQPVIICKSSDIEGKAHGTQVTRGLIDYEIAQIKPDGTGLSTVTLYKKT